jgi:hypothetical protein
MTGAKPRVVAMAADPATVGYWLLSSTGNAYNYGAPHYGGAPGLPAVGIAATPSARGFRTKTGQVLNFGDARNGGRGVIGMNGKATAVGITTDMRSGGYWVVLSSGRVVSFDCRSLGSARGRAAAALWPVCAG